MGIRNPRSLLRQRLLIGTAAGIGLTALDFVVFFLIPNIREETLHILSNLMEPLLLVTPSAAAGLCLIGYLLTFVFPSRR